jgi:pyridoxamine 5'-phosphate oxidase
MNLADLRQTYRKGSLDVNDVSPDPIAQFQNWFEEALAAQLPEPNAMHLATVGADGRPSGRIVLLKDLTEEGFTWYTNYQSRKARDLTRYPHAALTFFWIELERQVRVEGTVEPVSAAESDAYFATRPRASQLGAWASVQSELIPDRAFLETREAELAHRFGDGPIPRPPHWGGYRLRPSYLEFWQGRPSRLHDRITYQRTESGTWATARLSP